jgi:hypothetical protein
MKGMPAKLFSVRAFAEFVNKTYPNNGWVYVKYLTQTALFLPKNNTFRKNTVMFHPVELMVMNAQTAYHFINHDELVKKLGKNFGVYFNETRSRHMCDMVQVNQLIINPTPQKFWSESVGMIINYYDCENQPCYSEEDLFEEFDGKIEPFVYSPDLVRK